MGFNVRKEIRRIQTFLLSMYVREYSKYFHQTLKVGENSTAWSQISLSSSLLLCEEYNSKYSNHNSYRKNKDIWSKVFTAFHKTDDNPVRSEKSRKITESNHFLCNCCLGGVLPRMPSCEERPHWSLITVDTYSVHVDKHILISAHVWILVNSVGRKELWMIVYKTQ